MDPPADGSCADPNVSSATEGGPEVRVAQSLSRDLALACNRYDELARFSGQFKSAGEAPCLHAKTGPAGLANCWQITSSPSGAFANSKTTGALEVSATALPGPPNARGYGHER